MGNSSSAGPPSARGSGPGSGGPGNGGPRAEPPVQVLPQLPPVPLLRNTANGVHLQQFGTISSRPQGAGLRRPRSHSAHRLQKKEPFADLTRCDSEPDLRNPIIAAAPNKQHHLSRGRKKYRAPPAPHPGSGMESSSPDLNVWDATPRKARLFKTRAETNRRPHNEEDLLRRSVDDKTANESHKWSTVDGNRALQERRVDDKRTQQTSKTYSLSLPRSEQTTGKLQEEAVSLPRVDGRRFAEDPPPRLRARPQSTTFTNNLATPQFQAELLEAAQKLRPSSTLLPRPVYSPEPPTQTIVQLAKENAQPPKTFYFGMEESNKTVATQAINSNVKKTNREHRLTAVERSKNLMNLRHNQSSTRDQEERAVDKFAASFQKARAESRTSSLDSEPDPDEVDGIALQLRPTLPKKQLEIPRFSPTAAWRLLSSASSPSPDSDGERVAELHLSLDKSGDSGISGDASPGGETCTDLVDMPPKPGHVLYSHQQKPLVFAWTPEQDLEESSSSEEENPRPPSQGTVAGAKLTTRGHLFSTLPREKLDEPAREESGSRFNSLRHPSDSNWHLATGNTNWHLSRSVPGSVNSGHAPLVRTCSSPEQGEQIELLAKYPSFSYLAQGGHVVYLPEYLPHLSRSCENISQEENEHGPWSGLSQQRSMTQHRPHNKKKKFTFQSTVRLLENRRLAEKLSREAEFKESERLSEVEAMRRVEEEFQRKRAREKASIRHQLRLFSLEEKYDNFSSLPTLDQWEGGRAEPEGAPSSLPTAVPAPPRQQVLSEFRENDNRRDYRDYRQTRRSESPDVVSEARRQHVQHPRVVAEMPKTLPVYVSALKSTGPAVRGRADNYRKEFAHARAEEDTPQSVKPKSELPHTKPNQTLVLLQPFSSATRTFRPIVFTPGHSRAPPQIVN